jgi:hypothetical protein
LATLVFTGVACSSTSNNATASRDAAADASDAAAEVADAAIDVSGDVADGPEGGSPTRAFDEFVSALASRMCTWSFQCCSLADIDLIGSSAYVTLPECRPAMERQLRVWYGDARAAALEGRVTIDTKMAEACLRRFQDAGCPPVTSAGEGPWEMLQSCRDPLVGHVPTGHFCRLRDECEAGSRCVMGGAPMDTALEVTAEGVRGLPALQPAAMLGSCVAWAGEGDGCTDVTDCAPGLFCRRDDSVCARPAALGEPCVARDPRSLLPQVLLPCDDTVSSVICVDDLCSRLPRADEPCLIDGFHPPCDSDPTLALGCVGTSFNGSGICKPMGQSGDLCGPDGLPACRAGLSCLPPDGGSGLGVCGPRPKLGEPCDSNGACAEGACDLDAWLCAVNKRGRDGTQCQRASDCASNNCGTYLPLDGGTCLPPMLNFPTCTTGNSGAASDVSDGGVR